MLAAASVARRRRGAGRAADPALDRVLRRARLFRRKPRHSDARRQRRFRRRRAARPGRQAPGWAGSRIRWSRPGPPRTRRRRSAGASPTSARSWAAASTAIAPACPCARCRASANARRRSRPLPRSCRRRHFRRRRLRARRRACSTAVKEDETKPEAIASKAFYRLLYRGASLRARADARDRRAHRARRCRGLLSRELRRRARRGHDRRRRRPRARRAHRRAAHRGLAARARRAAAAAAGDAAARARRCASRIRHRKAISCSACRRWRAATRTISRCWSATTCSAAAASSRA